MSKDDIDKAVKDAEQYAAEDKKRREEVDVRNNADQMVFQTEKALGEFGDKVSAEEKSEIETKLSALKEALKSGSIDDIKAKQDDLQKAFYAISEKVYQQADVYKRQVCKCPIEYINRKLLHTMQGMRKFLSSIGRKQL